MHTRVPTGVVCVCRHLCESVRLHKLFGGEMKASAIRALVCVCWWGECVHGLQACVRVQVQSQAVVGDVKCEGIVLGMTTCPCEQGCTWVGVRGHGR